MSGGSFEYVCFKLDDEDDIFKSLPQLEEMESYLRIHRKHDAADEILKVKLQLETLRCRALVYGRRIKDIAYACEWWASGDWGEEGFDKVWEEFVMGKDD